jgi:uncharacterized membrane protein
VDILGAIFGVLIVLAVPFVVPIAAWVSARRARRRLDALETLVAEQRGELDALRLALETLGKRAAGAAPVQAEAEPARTEAVEPVQPAPAPEPTLVEPAMPEAVAAEPTAEPELPPPPPETPPVHEVSPPLVSEPAGEPSAPEREPAFVQFEAAASEPSGPPPAAPPPGPPAEEGPREPAFDWESLVGVKLFSAIAGIALVIAAVFFLRYSIEHGWLQPPVRVAIGIIVAIGLLVACELKAARKYPVTANALDAAAIAILFSTFFAAHALWNLIPGTVAFALLAMVTALAVLLSIRRESLFIAVLGLLGGFATPALLSTGENRPIPLFVYLLLLNVGLAWIAYRRTWPVLTWLTLILTTIYQWGWVFRFLDRRQVPLAMAVFIVFPLASIVGLLLRGRFREAQDAGQPAAFEHTALISAALPVVFAIYLAGIPEYGARPGLLFGFVLLLDLGLFAIAAARRQDVLHATGAVTTVLTLSIWLVTSYTDSARLLVLAFTSVYVIFYLIAPLIAEWFGRLLSPTGVRASFAAPALLFVFPTLAGMPSAAASPWIMFGTLLLLLVVIAWRAAMTSTGGLYFCAAFFAVAAQAIWSAAHLTPGRLGTAVAIYSAFGVIALGVPAIARWRGRPLRPAWGGGAVLIGSVLLLLFVAAGDVAPAALWALALLLAILNAALFIESGAENLPLVSQAGSVLSWFVLVIWWIRAAGSVGVIPSLTVLTGLGLVTVGGHAWNARARERENGTAAAGFASGQYLALAGHLFLAALASNPAWALPPWPVFGALVVLTLALSTAALFTRSPGLHAAGAVAASTVMASWSTAASALPYGLVALIGSAVVSAYAVGWIHLWPSADRTAGIAAGCVFFVAEAAALAAVASGGAPPFVLLVAAHAINLSAILWLTWRYNWQLVAPLAIVPAWIALFQWQGLHGDEWRQLLIFASALYAVFVAYPLVLGRRAAGERDPYLAAVIASAMFFFVARSAFDAGGLEWMIGVVPVASGAVLAVLLRQLLTIQPPSARDLGRLALVAGAALAFVTVAIPLQLERQWITIGWALEGAALAWLYSRIPHRGLFWSGAALLAVVFARLALNPEVLLYEPRGGPPILNWYLYTYAVCAASMFAAAVWLARTNDRVAEWAPRTSSLLSAAGVVLLFFLLNIEIADFYATGPTITFRFGVTVSQDLTYTIGWLAFGMLLLAAGIYLGNRPARVAAVVLIAVTTFKCFLYDLGSLEGLYRVASFVGLAMSLALVSLALQKYVLSKSRGTA